MTTATATNNLSVDQLTALVNQMTLQLATLQQDTQKVRAIYAKPEEYSELVPGARVTKIDTATGIMTYREMQAYCKKHNLKASGSKDALTSRIARHKSGTAQPTDLSKKGLSGKRKEYQAACKLKGLKASGKTAELAARAERAAKGEILPTDKAKNASGRRAFGLDYRRAQRVATYLKKQMPSAMLPTLVKNMGWNNVEANLTALMTTEWFAGLTADQIKVMAKECLLTDDMFQAFVSEVGI